MSWPLRMLIAPLLWAVAFAAIYAVHGLGCARGWVLMPGLFGNLHQSAMLGLWALALILGFWLMIRSWRLRSPEANLIRASDAIGLGSILLTLFPVLGLTSCLS